MEQNVPERNRELAELLRNRQFSAVADRIRFELAGKPLDAQLWVFLGQALEGKGELAGAWACFDRGWMLDPPAGWAEDARKRLGHQRGRPVPGWLEELLAVPQVTVAGAIIARDEADRIGRAIDRLGPAVDEIVVVDTGSRDQTAEIAREHGAKVFSFEWIDDFSAARNFGLQQVESDWVLWVDADEWLHPEDVHVPRTVAGLYHGNDPLTIVRIVQLNRVGTQVYPNYDSSRFFPTGRELRWWGRVHEQIGHEDGLMARLFPRPVVRIRVEHDGYDPVVLKERRKLERNAHLLRLAVEEDPEDVASWGFLGRELYSLRRHEEAIVALRRAELLAMKTPAYVRLPEVRTCLINVLLDLGRMADAKGVAEDLVRDAPEYPAGWYLLGKIQLGEAVKALEAAGKSFVATQERAKTYRGLVSYDQNLPGFNSIVGLADVAKLQGQWGRALELYQKALELRPDEMGVKQQVSNMAAEAERVKERLVLR